MLIERLLQHPRGEEVVVGIISVKREGGNDAVEAAAGHEAPEAEARVHRLAWSGTPVIRP